MSVTIASVNLGRFLGECGESALGQDYDLVKMLVGDEGSRDGSVRILRAVRGQRRPW